MRRLLLTRFVLGMALLSNLIKNLVFSLYLQNEERALWKLGTLPPGLITFYNLTYPLERSWYVLELGCDPALNKTEIENAAVVQWKVNRGL